MRLARIRRGLLRWGRMLARLGLVAMLPGAALAASPALCPPAVEDEVQTAALPHMAAALKPGGTLDILAVGLGPNPAAAGGAPVAAGAGGARQSTLAGQTARSLEAAVQGLHVSVTVIGGTGMLAPAQLDLLSAALKQHRYQLVLWQTGTLEAVNNEPTDDFYQALADGAGQVSAQGADLVLIEPQYSRFLDANASLTPYLSAMEALDALPGVMVFHRTQLMHDWVDAGLIDLEAASKLDRPRVAAQLHACLGMALAHALLQSASGE